MRAFWSISIRQAILLHHFLDRDRVAAPGTEVGQPLRGQVNVFKVIEIFKNCLTRIESLGTAGGFGEGFQAFFDVFGETNCQHRERPRSRYTSIADYGKVVCAFDGS
uniref:Uncharacterized protein n=1 Tax=mine drainage metagenome TaxID=410659 RepID=E6PXI6_9ZZZZ